MTTKTAAPVVSSRMSPAPGGAMTPWAIKGELILNCNCTVFCPCVISLGKHPPTEGVCQAWSGVRIDEGHYGDADLSGLNVGLLLEIPGRMARGNWKAAAFVDERADHNAYHGLIEIFSGRAKGTTGLFKVLVSEFLGAERAPVTYETEGKTRRLTVGRKIQGAVEPVRGRRPGEDIVATNTEYWMGPDITVGVATQGRVRAFGRVWGLRGPQRRDLPDRLVRARGAAVIAPEWVRMMARYGAHQNAAYADLTADLDEPAWWADRGGVLRVVGRHREPHPLGPISSGCRGCRPIPCRPAGAGGLDIAATRPGWAEMRGEADARMAAWADGLTEADLAGELEWVSGMFGPQRRGATSSCRTCSTTPRITGARSTPC